jgi:hypothetical protein
VTRLGEFLPLGRLSILDYFLTITEIPFPRKKSYVLIFENVFGYVLGDFSPTRLVTLLHTSVCSATDIFFRPDFLAVSFGVIKRKN